ncbi:DUF803-domain-containing protein [Ramaria rubella]|nr:DUF803-domain-containing protein [Ramaria rubella]
MVDDKYIGLALAVSSSLAIGTSFIITKKGLNDAARRNSDFTQASEDRSYLRNPIWWAGMLTTANFAAYTFAPPILVTPLGALSVLIGAVLASFLLKEELGHIGRVGCGLCLVGSFIIVLHAPEDKEITTVDEILHYAVQPGFLLYCFTVLVFALIMIYYVSPRYGTRNPLVYISICSLVGSISIMAVKGFGVALKLTLAGNNQLTHPSTYVFGIVVVVCILVQMNYFNKALDTFSTNVVNPMYYVTFSTATIVASLILFQGFNTTSATDTLSLLTGFVVTFLGVHLLNLSRNEADDLPSRTERMSLENGLMDPQRSSGRLSAEGGWPASPHAIGLNGVPGHVRRNSRGSLHGSGSGSLGGTTLFNTYDGEPDGAVALEPLGEEEEEEEEDSDERSRLNPAKRNRPRGATERDIGVGRGSRNHSGERIAR